MSESLDLADVQDEVTDDKAEDVQADIEEEELDDEDEPEIDDGQDEEESVPADDKIEQQEKDAESAQKHEFDKERQQEQQLLANAQRQLAEKDRELEQAKLSARTKTDEDTDPLEAINILQSQQEQMRQVLVSQQEKIDERDAQDVLVDFYRIMDDTHGADHRNNALANGRQTALNRGFSFEGSNTPTLQQTMDYIEMGYQQSVIDNPTLGKANKNKRRVPKPSGREDTGRSGKAEKTTKPFCGTPDDVIADMQRDGKLRDYNEET